MVHSFFKSCVSILSINFLTGPKRGTLISLSISYNGTKTKALQVISSERLSIPHPEITNRAFVLVPLYEIDKEIKVPLLGPVRKLIDSIDTHDLKKL
jgi:hypothetical protein